MLHVYEESVISLTALLSAAVKWRIRSQARLFTFVHGVTWPEQQPAFINVGDMHSGVPVAVQLQSGACACEQLRDVTQLVFYSSRRPAFILHAHEQTRTSSQPCGLQR